MTHDSFFGKFLRFIGILLMALTAGFTLLGGLGTTCAALSPTSYESMKSLAPFQWLYITFVLVGIALGILGIRATILLIKGKPTAYRDSLIVLIAGSAVGILHMLVSQALRGKSMPVDAVVYTTLLTLAVFLIFRIPAIWQIVDFNRGNSSSNLPAAAAAAILLGMTTLTIQFTMGSTHTWGGVNYADAFNTSMTVVGLVCLVFGTGLLVRITRTPALRGSSCERRPGQERCSIGWRAVKPARTR